MKFLRKLFNRKSQISPEPLPELPESDGPLAKLNKLYVMLRIFAVLVNLCFFLGGLLLNFIRWLLL